MAEPIKLHPERTQKAVAKESATGSCHGHAGHDHAQHAHDHAAGPASGAEHRVKDPVCGMDVDPHTAKHRAEHQGRTYYFCSAGCRTKFVENPARYLDAGVAQAKAEPVPEGTIYTCPMHPADPAGGAGFVPDLRHGARTGSGQRRSGTEPRTDRHDAPVLDRPRSVASGRRAGDGRAPHRPQPLRQPADLELDPDGAGDPGRAVGRLAVLRARLAVARHAQPQHVHPDRDGDGRRLGLQRRRDARAGHLPGRLPRA